MRVKKFLHLFYFLGVFIVFILFCYQGIQNRDIKIDVNIAGSLFE